MRNVSIAVAGALALLLAGIFVWNAKATPLTGAATAGSATSYLLLEKVGRKCPKGQRMVCTSQGCACSPPTDAQPLTCNSPI